MNSRRPLRLGPVLFDGLRLDRARLNAGFTLVELVIVVLIIGVMLTLLGISTGSFAAWREEGFVRRLSETISFLHNQAVIDQEYYRLEFDLGSQEYRVGVMKRLGNAQGTATADAGNLSLELADFLTPSLSGEQEVIPPPSFPSLAEPTPFPSGMVMTAIRTPRGRKVIRENEEGKQWLLFSPRGFSEFGVLNFRLSSGGDVTIIVNSFTGTADIHRDERDVEPEKQFEQ